MERYEEQQQDKYWPLYKTEEVKQHRKDLIKTDYVSEENKSDTDSFELVNRRSSSIENIHKEKFFLESKDMMNKTFKRKKISKFFSNLGKSKPRVTKKVIS